jgi:hypothetical protein
MDDQVKNQTPGSPFHLNKWFLDFVSHSGEAMIFYAARLTWHGLSVSYTSWLHHVKSTGVTFKSRLHHIHMPEISGDLITWSDPGFGVSGTWHAKAKPIAARLFDSAEGHLDWSCFQPRSEVTLIINDNHLEGKGYAEQLILTAPPWKIPMDELRWGRFGAEDYYMVWIELREQEKKQWLWLNSVREDQCIIEDDMVSIPRKEIELRLDRGVSLEAEKKIFSVVEHLVRYIPGFNKVMPVRFLMADESKWLSKAQLVSKGIRIADGMAIHELVNFKPPSI